MNNEDVEKIKKLNLKTIDEIIKFIVNNRDELGIYFFLGSGFVNYVSNDDKSWKNMANQKFYNKLDINSFADLIYIDFDYKNEIKKINENQKKYKNYGLRDLWNTFSFFNSSTQKFNNKLKIITTNHCNTIENYFLLSNIFNLNDLILFNNKTHNYSILKMHNFSNNEFIYNVESYWKFFNDENNYYKILSNFFQYEFKEKNNIIFIFGSSYSELHINTLFRSVISRENIIIWIRDLTEVLNLDKSIQDYKSIPISEIKKFHKEYKNNNHLILFFNEDNDKNLSANSIFNHIIEKWNNELKKVIKFFENFTINSNGKLNLKNIDEEILKDFNNKKKNKIKELNFKLKNKDYLYLACVLIHNIYKDKQILEWYFKNIKNTINTPININWLIETPSFKLINLVSCKKLVNNMIKSNLDISQFSSDLFIDLISKIKISWKNEKEWKWIVNFSFNKIIQIEKKGFYSSKSAFFIEVTNFNEFKKMEMIDKNCLNFVEEQVINYKKNQLYIDKIKLLFYLYELSILIHKKIDIVNLILNTFNTNINNFLSEITFFNYFNSFDKRILNITINLFEIYFEEHNNILLNIFNNNSNDVLLNLYIIINHSKRLQKYLNKFTNEQKKDFDKLLKQTYIGEDNISFLDKNFKNISQDIKNDKYDNVLKKIHEIYNDLELLKDVTSFDFFYFITNIFNDIILKLNNNSDIKKTTKILKKCDDLIVEYNKNYAIKSVEYFNSYHKSFEELKLEKVIEIIDYLQVNNFIWFFNTFIHNFVFNGRLNPSFDFYYIMNKNFAFISLIEKLNIRKIYIERFFDKDENYNLIKTYYDIVKVKINDWNDEETIYLKYIYDVYFQKKDSVKKIIKNEIFNSKFFSFIKKFKFENSFNERIVYLFISNCIEYKEHIEDFLKIFLSNNHFEYMENKYNDYFLNFLKISFEKMNINNKEKVYEIFNSYLYKKIQHIKTFVLNFDEIKDSLFFAKKMTELYNEEYRDNLSSENEIKYFCDAILNIFEFINKNNISKYTIEIGNIILSILSIYKINTFKENIEYQLWNELYSLLFLLAKIGVKNLKEKDFLEEINKFIKNNIDYDR